MGFIVYPQSSLRCARLLGSASIFKVVSLSLGLAFWITCYQVQKDFTFPLLGSTFFFELYLIFILIVTARWFYILYYFIVGNV